MAIVLQPLAMHDPNPLFFVTFGGALYASFKQGLCRPGPASFFPKPLHKRGADQRRDLQRQTPLWLRQKPFRMTLALGDDLIPPTYS
jgi:hypothetical protein